MVFAENSNQLEPCYALGLKMERKPIFTNEKNLKKSIIKCSNTGKTLPVPQLVLESSSLARSCFELPPKLVVYNFYLQYKFYGKVYF